jgi:uncharacterized membrane protein
MDIAKKFSWVRLNKFRWLLVIAVSLLFIGWLLNTPSGLLGKADAVGYAVCHRIDARSFHIGDRQVPLCARCTGMFLGAMLGLCYQAYFGKKRSGAPPIQVIVVLTFFVFAFIVDGLNSYVSLIPGINPVYEPFNELRLITGTGIGLVIAAALFPAFNQSVWKNIDRNSGLTNLRSLGILVILALVLDVVLLTENPLILYPLALISAAGVVVLLTTVYTIIFIMALRKECQYSTWKELLFPLIAGFGMALLQLALMDIIRYWLTGTWEGFHLG